MSSSGGWGVNRGVARETIGLFIEQFGLWPAAAIPGRVKRMDQLNFIVNSRLPRLRVGFRYQKLRDFTAELSCAGRIDVAFAVSNVSINLFILDERFYV